MEIQVKSSIYSQWTEDHQRRYLELSFGTARTAKDMEK
jgi:hypothetical protein